MPAFTTNLKVGPITAKATNQISNFNFNSYIETDDGRIICAGEEGIFEIKGDDHNGDPIACLVETATVDLGQPSQVRFIRINLETDGAIVITPIVDGIAYSPIDAENVRTSGQQYIEATVESDIIGRNWQLRIENVDGCDIGIDDIEVTFILMPEGFQAYALPE